jgi:hypothetical protein
VSFYVNKIANRLGLRGKRLETPMAILRARFNMVWESETVDKVKQYRIWTRKNYELYKAASMPMRPQMVPFTKALPQTNPENSLAIVEHTVEDTNLGSCGAEQPIVIREAITSSSSGVHRKKDWRYPCIPTNSSVAIRELRILQKLTVCTYLNVLIKE